MTCGSNLNRVKKLFLAIVLVFWPICAFAQTYSTSFPLIENPISERGKWVGGQSADGNLWGNVQTSGGMAYGISEPTTYGDPTAILTGSWAANQQAQVTVKINTTSTVCCHEIEVRLRVTISANSITGYEVYCSVVPGSKYCHIARWSGPNGLYCNIEPSSPGINLVNGDVLMGSVTGSNPALITAYLNGVQIMQVSDTGNEGGEGSDCGAGRPVFTSGSPGIGFYDNQNDNQWNYFGVSNFTANAELSHGQQHPPEIRVFKTVGTTKITAHIFHPEGSVVDKPAPVIVLIHGGGWSAGSPEWVYADAKRYAEYGAVAVATEYRLCDWAKVTPLDSLADIRDLVVWLRANSKELGIDSSRLAVYGVSAGGHLAAALATIPDPGRPEIDLAPQALLMISPALSVTQYHYFQGLLLGKATAASLSPDEHIRHRIPPTIIFHGVKDNVVPIAGARQFCHRARKYKSQCEVVEYANVGHLLTRKLDNQIDTFDPDPKDVADSIAKGDAFLAAQGFLPLLSARTR